jgi:hypothetical protein
MKSGKYFLYESHIITLRTNSSTKHIAQKHHDHIVEDKDEGGFLVSYPDLPGCITCGETVGTAVENALDEKKYGLKQCLKMGFRLKSQTIWKIISDSLNFVFLAVYTGH